MKNFILTLSLMFAVGFTAAQSITAVTPDSAAQNDTVTVSITGSGTQFTKDSFIISLFNQQHIIFSNSNSIQVINDELMEVDFAFSYQDHPGIYDVNVRNALYNATVDLTLENGFQLTSLLGPEMPEITHSTPKYARIGDTVTLTITGKTTKFSQYDTNILLLSSVENSDNIIAESAHVVNDTTIQGVFILSPGLSTGFYALKYVSNYLTVPVFMRSNYAFELLPKKGTAPEVVEVTPNQGIQGETVTLTIKTFKTDLTLADPDSLIHALIRDNGTTFIFPDTSAVIDSVTIEAVYTFTKNHEPGIYDYNVYIPEQSILMETRDVFTLFEPTSVSNPSIGDFPVKVYPNPADDVLFIETPNAQNFTVRLYDFSGRVLKVNDIRDNQRHELDLSQFPAGIYLVEIKSEHRQRVEKIIKR